MKTEIKFITPELAKEMLKRNGNNRKVSQNHVNFLANEMIGGNWQFDGQPIRFSEGGVLLDGQHRLSAVIASDCAQKFLVITGIEQSAFKVMDTGKNRNTADIFSIEGINYAAATSAACRMIINFKKGLNSQNNGNKPSNSDVLSFYNLNKIAINNCVRSAKKYYQDFNKVMPLSQITGFMFLFGEKHILQSEEFFYKLCTGNGLTDKDPIKHLRNKLIREKIARLSLPTAEKYAIIILTWNATRKGRENNRLVSWKKGAKFPKII
jgi:hypothetical protein